LLLNFDLAKGGGFSPLLGCALLGEKSAIRILPRDGLENGNFL